MHTSTSGTQTLGRLESIIESVSKAATDKKYVLFPLKRRREIPSDDGSDDEFNHSTNNVTLDDSLDDASPNDTDDFVIHSKRTITVSSNECELKVTTAHKNFI